jgi:kynurenine formamidase
LGKHLKDSLFVGLDNKNVKHYPGVECVANLSEVPKTGATVIVGAPKVGKATGGISRIIAVW